jgi:CheY-like chemotaxis protein
MHLSTPQENTGFTAPPTPASVRVLLLDDSSFDRARIKRLSRKASMVVHLDEVGSIEEMARAVRQSRYDLILIDYRLPVGDGMQALELVLQNPSNCNAGKIMITGDNAVNTAVRAMRGGCHDFLVKDGMNAELLSQAMTNAMALARQNQVLQSDMQRENIRQGVVAALNDSEVRHNVAAILRAELGGTRTDRTKIINTMDPSDLDALLAGLNEDDTFTFH